MGEESTTAFGLERWPREPSLLVGDASSSPRSALNPLLGAVPIAGGPAFKAVAAPYRCFGWGKLRLSGDCGEPGGDAPGWPMNDEVSLERDALLGYVGGRTGRSRSSAIGCGRIVRKAWGPPKGKLLHETCLTST